MKRKKTETSPPVATQEAATTTTTASRRKERADDTANFENRRSLGRRNGVENRVDEMAIFVNPEIRVDEDDGDQPVEITDAWIRTELQRRRDIRKSNPYAEFREYVTDANQEGFMVWFYNNLKRVSFVLRMRAMVDGKKGRFSEVFGKWDDPKIVGDVAFTAKKARTEFIIRRARYEQGGVKNEKPIPNLRDAIEEYIVARRDKRDPRTCKKGLALPASWGATGKTSLGYTQRREGHIGRFMDIYERFLDKPVSALNYNSLLDARNAYVGRHSDGRKFEDELKKIRSTVTTTMPMLKWFKKVGYMPDGEGVEDLKPQAYEKDTRFLYPGEWQASCQPIDELPLQAGLFMRFVLTTAVRAETALGMEWSELDWGNFEHFRDFDDHEQAFLTWIVPRRVGRLKGRGKTASEDAPRRVMITGDSLRILHRLRAIYEENLAANPEDTYRGVFPKKVVSRWRSHRSRMQRDIEAAAGTKRWDRYTLRKTHSTYLEYLQCPKYLRSMSLTHTPSGEGGSTAGEHYDHADAVRASGTDKHDPLVELGPWHIRLHKLFRDMEFGDTKGDLGRLLPALRRGSKSSDMRDRYGIDEKFIEVTPRAPKLRVVA